MRTAAIKDYSATDRAGRLPNGKIFAFQTLAQFASDENIGERQVRNLMDAGLPFHGEKHKGATSLRFGETAHRWLKEVYRPNSRRGRRFYQDRAGRETLDFIEFDRLDEKQAFARLYKLPIPKDEFLESEEFWEEAEQWKGFKALKRPTKVKR